MLTDAQLLTSSGHDPEAFRALYDRHAGAVHGFFVRRTGDHDASLDLTAETFAQVWSSRHRFDDRHAGSIAPWLFGIASNVLARSARERRLVHEASESLRLQRRSPGATPDPSWIDGLDADLERALDDLPESQRRAVELRIMDDLSYDDVADELDCSPTAARIRVSRGLSRLRASTTPSNRSCPQETP